MGGNALRHLNVRRISRAELDEMQREIRRRIQFIYQHVSFPTQLATKNDFGDIDVIVDAESMDVAALAVALGTRGYVQNTYIVSMEFMDVQVDFIHVALASVENARAYVSYSGLGALIGLFLGPSTGLKYTHDGLWIREPYTYCISTRVDDIMAFLGMDASQFERELTPLDICAYVASHMGVPREFVNRQFRRNTSELLQTFFENAHALRSRKRVWCVKDALDQFGLHAVYAALVQAHATECEKRERVRARIPFELVCELHPELETPKVAGAWMRAFKERFSHDTILSWDDAELRAQLALFQLR